MLQRRHVNLHVFQHVVQNFAYVGDTRNAFSVFFGLDYFLITTSSAPCGKVQVTWILLRKTCGHLHILGLFALQILGPFGHFIELSLLLEKMNLSRGRADLEDGLEGLREDGADALEAG